MGKLQHIFGLIKACKFKILEDNQCPWNYYTVVKLNTQEEWLDKIQIAEMTYLRTVKITYKERSYTK